MLSFLLAAALAGAGGNEQIGTLEFHCTVFCGSGHEEMSGVIVVKP